MEKMWLVCNQPRRREFVAPSPNMEFAGCSDTLGVVCNVFRPVGGEEVKWMWEAPEEVRQAFRRMTTECGNGFREEFRLPGYLGWYAIQIE